MPKYVYVCQNCNTRREIVHSMSEDYNGAKCKFCAQKKLERVPEYFNTFIEGRPPTERKVGDLVLAAIKEMTEDLGNYYEEMTGEDAKEVAKK